MLILCLCSFSLSCLHPHRLLDSMKQRSSSFQISDILGLPQKDNTNPGDDASPHHHTQTSLPPASISSALHSSNNPYSNFSPPQPTTPYHLHHHQSPVKSPPGAADPILLTNIGAPSSASYLPNDDPTTATNVQPRPPGHLPAAQSLIDSKPPPPTGGYLPGNLNSSMFLESAAAAQHYNNLFGGRNWHLDNSSDHYGE